MDVADEFWRTRKVRVDRRKTDLPNPIKRIGRYEIPIELFQDVRIEVKTPSSRKAASCRPRTRPSRWPRARRPKARPGQPKPPPRPQPKSPQRLLPQPA